MSTTFSRKAILTPTNKNSNSKKKIFLRLTKLANKVIRTSQVKVRSINKLT